jgi:phosphate/sulfate permease
MKTANLKLSIVTALIVTSYMTFVIVAVNIGFVSNFVFMWLRSWFIAFLIATPSIHLIAPYIKEKVNKKKL